MNEYLGLNNSILRILQKINELVELWYILACLGQKMWGKTSILWLFKKYIDEGLIKRVDKNIVVKRLEEDFRGESKVTEGGVNLTITITPNRLVFNESKTGSNHTLFAPGGHKTEML